MNRKEIIDLLELTISVYPNAKIKDANKMVVVWEMELGEYPAEKIYKAVRYHMAVNKFFPTPADILSSLVRAEICYSQPIKCPYMIGSGGSGLVKVENVDDYLDSFCEWIGFGEDEALQS